MRDHCPSCGADVDRSGTRVHCGHCGARFADGVFDLEVYRRGPERFDRVAVAPGYAAAMRHTPELSAVREVAHPVLHLVGAGAVVIAMIVAAIGEGEGSMLLLSLAIGLGALVIVGPGVLFALRRIRAPTQRIVAVVNDDRYVPTGDDRDPAGVCEHRVTLEERDGRTRKVYAPADLMGEVAVGDIGVAYLRRDRLVEYRWFDVMAPPLEPGEIPRAAGCNHCGAHQRFGHVSERCAFCGEPLPRPDLGEFGARFRTAAASPAAHDACQRRIQGGVPSLWPPLGIVALGGFLAWFAWQLRELAAAAVELSPLFLLPLVALIAPLIHGAIQLWWGSAPHRAGQHNQLVVIVRKRAQRIEKRDKVIWRHYVTIASPSGTRCELQAMASVAESVHGGQLGVAHLRGDWFAGFTELDSAPR